MSDSTHPIGPPMRTFDYTSHVGPNKTGLHDQAVHAQQPPKESGDAGQDTPASPALPAAPAPTEG